MSFLYPWFLSLILPIIIYLFLKKKKNTIQYIHWGIVILLILSISRPVIKESNQKEKLKIGSIILAFDVSASMRANDIKPNRLLSSKKTIKLFLERNKKNQIALIAFSSNPLLLSPLSTDSKLIISSLNALNEKYILTKGTDIKKLLYKVSKFPLKKKLLVIFSDGGDDIIDNKLIKFIKANHIKILNIAVATKRGSTIKIDDKLLRDKNGHIVVSNLNSELYKLGDVIEFSTPQKVVKDIQSWIKKEILKDTTKKQKIKYFELFFIPTLLALILLFLSETKYISKLIWLLMLLGVNANGGIIDNYYLNKAYHLYKNGEYNNSIKTISKIENKSLESEIIKSNSYYKLKKYKKAKEILLSIKTTNPQIKQKLLYNLGNCEAKLLDFQRAKKHYIKALNIKEDNDILHNLQIVIFLKNSSTPLNKMVTKPTAQGEDTNSNKKSKEQNRASNKNNQQNSSGGNSKTKQTSISKKSSISKQLNNSQKKFSSKAYELINKGYINEDKPW